MRNRIFIKLLAAFSLVIAAATVIFDFSVHGAWEGAMLAFVVALIVSALAARSLARRLQRVVHFANRIAAGDLAARIDEASQDEIGKVASLARQECWTSGRKLCGVADQPASARNATQ